MVGWPPRHCIACGGRLRLATIEGHARRRCPECGWIFYGNPVPAAAALIVRRGRVLLTLRARPPHAGTWDLPGGFLESGETPEQALRRELREELGITGTGRRPRLIGFFADRYGRDGIPIITVVYRVTAPAGRLRPGDDVAEARWFSRAKLPYRQIAFRSMRHALRAWAAPKSLQDQRFTARKIEERPG